GDITGPTELADFSARVAVSRPKFRVFFGASSILEHSNQGTVASIGTNGFLSPTFASTVAISRRWAWNFSLGLGLGGDLSRSVLVVPEHCDAAVCPGRVAAEQGYMKMEQPLGAAGAADSA